MRVRLTPDARAKIDAVLAAILREDRFAAQRYREKIGRSLRQLGRFPAAATLYQNIRRRQSSNS